MPTPWTAAGRLLVVTVAQCLTIIIAACATDGARTNREACQQYVEALNQIYRDCGVAEPFDEDNECPATLDAYPEDCTAYYDCLREVYWCDEPGDVDNTQEDCESCF
jgi:hypothetical protein